MSLNTREVLAQETLKKGNKAPSFTLKDQDGHDFRLADHIGKHNVVIFFYPQDKSPICTKEACTFRDAYQKYKEANAIVVGINSGTIESHKAFHTTEHLPFDLLSDPDNKVLSLFGVKEQDFGKVKVTGRETFVIGKDGLVVYSFRDFMKGDEHSNQVLAYLTGNK
jgi:peroxiredoxin Q/BCP